MAKSKKNRQQDFQKVKLKVGKKLKKADNVTNASFKTRAIQISQQLKTGDSSQPSTKKKQNINDLFSQCRHYSTSVRVEAVNGLKELIATNPELVHTHLSDMLERVAELLTDKDSNVRTGAIRVFKSCLPLVSEKEMSPFFPLLCAHLCCAMTHIFDDIQMDSLAVLDLLLENYPRLMIYKSSQVLSNFIEQISRQKGQGQAKRSLSTNPNSATSSVKWRNSVLNRLHKFLAAILKFHGTSSEVTCMPEGVDSVTSHEVTFSDDECMSVQTFPVYVQNQWMMPGVTVSSSNTKEVDGQSDLLNGKFPEFANTLIPLMLECWVESAPSKDRNKTSGGNVLAGDSVGMMYTILQVTQLLWECISVLSTKEESCEPVGQSRYLREFEQHFMASFPYSVNTRVTTKGKKQPADNVKVSAEILNLTICNIMTHFIGERSTSHRQSHDPAWLPLVTKYMNDLLKGKYGKAGVGQSSRTVVTILERLITRGFVDGPVLGIIEEVYNRFEAANIASTEKKVYMQFFADTMLADQSEFISPQLRRKFLHSLPVLLPLCTKGNSEITSLVINTMKKAACQRCSDLLNRKQFNICGQQWYDPKGEVISSLSPEDQKSLIGLLYYAPDIGLELTKTLVSMARCTSINDNLVAFMIQVLQNRFLRSDMRTEVATVHIGFLTNLLLGVSRSEIESLANEKRNANIHVLGKYNIVQNSVLECENTSESDRQSFIVEVVSSIIQQFYNTDQVVEVIFEFIEKILQNSITVPLKFVFGICKFAESLSSIPPTVVALVSGLCISLVSHLVAWQQSTNQNAVKEMLDIGCNLLIKVPCGLENLLTEAKACYNRDISEENVVLLVRTVMLFLTEGRRQYIRERPECIQHVSDFNTTLQTYCKQHKEQVTAEAEKITGSFSYLVSCLM